MNKTQKKTVKRKSKISIAPTVSKKELAQRKKYLTERINKLLDEISDWLEGTEYSLKKTNMQIEDYKLPAADIYFENKVITSLKPTGLWAFGVNCRIDVVSKRENSILFDVADEKKPVDWELIATEPHKSPKKLTKMIFRNYLKKNNTILRLVEK